MIVDIKVPSPGESITEVEISNWLVSDGDHVDKDQEICEIDSDKATLTVSAEESGKIKILKESEKTILVGDIICQIDTSVKSSKKKNVAINTDKPIPQSPKANMGQTASPAAKKIIREQNLKDVIGTGKGGRITKQDVISSKPAMGPGKGERKITRKRLSTLRRKLANRLVVVKNETAMLTTFNEVNMSVINAIRSQYKDQFLNKHNVKLGYMSFFTQSVARALKMFPNINSMIDGDELVSFDYADISIAVSSPKGLVVPVLRNSDQMSFADIEKSIALLGDKARNGKITIEDLQGGTFTITNGGIYGSMLSTPILNPPQSGVLGMHNIIERAVVKDGNIIVRPMMYLALSYDHRIIDGKEAVSFLKNVKDFLEDPKRLFLDL